MVTKLAEKQENFLQLYVKKFNITLAYREAYPTCKTDGSAATSGSMLLTKPKVKLRLAEILKERNERTGVDSTYVIEYLKGAVELDLEDFAKIGKDGVEIKEFKKIPKSIRKYCTEVNMSETKRGTIMVNFKVFNKEKALEMLAKHTGATRERLELSGNVTVNSITDLVNNHGTD
jgi:phage terminase small subunit